ncbi:MAG: SxtJ family membrane protein [Bacteroidales bacterium]|nr:SxtJ family membrane protein [Bacteroidales bacterium]MDD4575470.1 SxtJ family membrane protein [Bacteroidales bacterium]
MKNKNYSLTILTLVTALNIAFYITDIPVLFYTSIGLGLIGLFSKSISKIIHFCWFKFADFLAYFSSKIILSVVFIFLLTPIAWVAKIFKKEDKFRTLNSTKSNFLDRNEDYSNKSIFNKTW